MTEAREVSLIFSHRKWNLVSWLIRRHQGAPYSHVCIGFYSNYFDLDLVYEATGSGVTLLTYDNWLAKGNEVVGQKDFSLHNNHFRVKLVTAYSYLGKPYGFRTILGILFRGRKLGQDGKASFICSELAYDFLEYELSALKKEGDRVTPKDLYNLVRVK